MLRTAWHSPARRSLARACSSVGARARSEISRAFGYVYGDNIPTTHSLASYRAAFADLAPGERRADANAVCVAGRIVSKREVSSKLIFYHIEGGNGLNDRLQVIAPVQQYSGDKEEFRARHTATRRGDVIAVTGFPGASKTGEISVVSREIHMLAPCFHPLPAEGALHSQGERLGNRVLDLLNHSDVRTKMMTRSRIVSQIRNFFEDRGFVEVETPLLGVGCGEGTARPFLTHHHAYNKALSLRIAPEIALKMAAVGGFERVFEIGRVFRNEGVDATHHPEFTSCEAYQAFASREDMIHMTQNLLSDIAGKCCGDTSIAFGSDRIEWAAPYRTMPFVDSLEASVSCLTSEPLHDALQWDDAAETNKFLKDLCARANIAMEPSCTTAQCLDALFSEHVERDIVQPTFVVDIPTIMSPLARPLFAARRELANAYNELTDPEEQRRRFALQRAEKEGNAAERVGDTHLEQLFTHALGYGLPPTYGWGLGVDRLTMLLTNSPTIREVILFPLARGDRSPSSDASHE